MDVHIYKKGKYIRTDRNVKSGIIEVDGDPSDYQITMVEPQEQILPPTRWPNAGEEGGAEL